MLDASGRAYSQTKALFYSDNAQSETLYISRNRQLSTFKSTSLLAKLSYTLSGMPAGYDVKLTGAYELKRFRFNDFTDRRTGNLYSYNASVVQVYVSANF